MSSHINIDLELLAVSSIILNDEVGDYVGKLKPAWLMDATARRAWTTAKAYHEDHRESIPKEVLRETVPSFRFRASTSSVDGVLESLQERYLRTQIETIYEDEVAVMENPVASLASLISRSTTLQASIQRDTGSDISETIDESWERYEHRKANRGALGLAWPWAPLQRETNGAQSGSYNLIYARPKQQKTFVLLKCVKHWVKHFRRKVLIVTREMTKDQIQDRLLCLWAKVEYRLFRCGDLTVVEEAKIAVAREEIKQIGRIIVETVETYGAEAASEVSALADQYGLEEDDVVAVDGIDWFALDERWESLRSFSKGLKKLAVGGKVNGRAQRALIILVAGQGNQNFKSDQHADAGKEMSGGDGPIRDCDLALKLQYNREEKDVTVDIAAIREGDSVRFVINAIPCVDYSLKYSTDPEADQETDTMPAAPSVVGTKSSKKKKGSKHANVRPGQTTKSTSKVGGSKKGSKGRVKQRKRGSKGSSAFA
ncbi:MAG: DnaB-like helicase C-terminal domain-containing protein [Candidatus Thorarchaeota archaeon]|jgi:hypothetical protein